jgi:hypothetical protein
LDQREVVRHVERRHEYRRRLIAVEKSWRDAQVAILFGQGVAKGSVRYE